MALIIIINLALAVISLIIGYLFCTNKADRFIGMYFKRPPKSGNTKTKYSKYSTKHYFLCSFLYLLTAAAIYFSQNIYACIIGDGLVVIKCSLYEQGIKKLIAS